MIIAFFDFDGTITKKDSFLDFVKFTHGKRKLQLGLLLYSIHILFYKLNWFPGQRMKELFLKHYYKGLSKNKFKQLGVDYCNRQLPNIIHAKALKRIQWHKEQKHKVVVITASLSQWIQPWCDDLDIDLISTEAEIIDGKVTGKLNGKNCNGPEKVSRIKETFDFKSITYSYAYGNSSGDKELLAIANEKFYQYF
ncbi:HAD family hydrolase [Aquimarina sp. 2201CG5-10]|uniref:HAD family hydrolase n=1 Tax=Aquimarina callyspongiae TaxID=3098150 RepID=UPI002AB3FA1A|nr:HAD family hydrolase [Aquimarina sp. 2201CG5-10]MDY8135845.1 HAD family hydrolase [Aquimarina sp. 2201CG5-10]